MKKSYANCSLCPLYEKPIVIGESSHNELDKIRLLVLAEAPSKEEVKNNKPLCGPAGKIFRQAFNKLKLNQIPHIITNVCLCANLDKNNKNSNPPLEALECCKINWQTLIKNLPNLELILIMGSMPMKVFDIAESGILKLRGKFYTYNNINVMLTIHPSYILRNGGIGSESYNLFESDLKLIKENLNKPVLRNNVNVSKSEDVNIESARGINENYLYYFTLPSEYYKEEYCLFDVQYLRNKHTILYIFLDKNGNKVYYKIKDDIQYYYTKEGNALDYETILPASNVNLHLNFYDIKPDDKEKYTFFERDVKLEFKHVIDYRIKREAEEIPCKLKIQFMDIEVFSDGSLEFPRPEIANKPINAISFKNGDSQTNVYIARFPQMDQSAIQERDDVNIKLFDTERELLLAYCKEIKKYDPHIITAWNGLGFDLPYIYNRMQKNGIDVNMLSPIGETSFDFERYGNHFIYGLHFLDLLEVYKMFTYNQESSYKLGSIARKELSKDKVAYEGTLDNIYIKDINKFIEYSKVDTELLFELEEKLKFIELLYEMIRICSSTWNASKSTMGLIDPLIVSYAKKNGYVCKDAIHERDGGSEPIKGAYVREPISGLHSYIVDFDFSSLYPSTIVTYNMDPSITMIASIDDKLAYKYIYKKDEMPEKFTIILYPYKKNVISKTITLEKFDEFLKKYKGIININGTIFLGHDYKESFISKVVKYLLDSRKEYRQKMRKLDKKSNEYHVCSNRQLVYKITNNSIYGVLANKHFRFFNERMAEAITKTGQEVSKFVQYHLGHYLKTGNKDIDSDFMIKSEDQIPFICYGDTDSIFVNIYDYLYSKNLIAKDDPDIVEKVLSCCKELENYLNNELLVKFVELHNIKPDNSLLNLKQEVVADRALFPNVKKRYCLHIINKDGRPVDEYDIKGICLKRSEYPDKTKEYIKQLLDLILKPKTINFHEIKDFIEEKKREIYDLCAEGDASIARMVNFTKPISEYKNNKVPFHIEAMLLWNKLEYECFFHGTKGKLFFIKGIDENRAPEHIQKRKHLLSKKNTSIVIPEDLERLPDYYIVDVEKMIEYCWIERYKEITECLQRK